MPLSNCRTGKSFTSKMNIPSYGLSGMCSKMFVSAISRGQDAQERWDKRACLFPVLLQCVLDDAPDGRILLAELGRHLRMMRVLHHAQQIMIHQHLHEQRQTLQELCCGFSRSKFFLGMERPALASGSAVHRPSARAI